jgi:glucose/arabinose dehydrogenase
MPRPFRAGAALLLAGLLTACLGEPSVPDPTAGVPTLAPLATTAAATAVPPTLTTPNTPIPAGEGSATAAVPPTATTAAAANTPTPATGGGTAKTALDLQPVRIETTDATRKGVFVDTRSLNLPAGFRVNMYVTGLDGVRWLGLGPDGLLYATAPGGGTVYTLPDANGDGVADTIHTFAANLPGVHGIAFHDGAVYVATQTTLVRLRDTNGDQTADTREVLATDLPSGGVHITRTLLFLPDGYLLVAAVSSCYVCVEINPKRAAISLYTAEGKFQRVYAGGLRNAVGLILQPGSNTVWATNNGRDNLGDNIPPETVYQIQDGVNYGWPYCYGARIPDTSQNPPSANYCAQTGAPAVEMQAHSAPLGAAFYAGSGFPAQFAGDLFVAFHGSWNRSVPTGYKLVRIRFANGQPDAGAGAQLIEDFATGWQQASGVWGRPVDPLVAPDGTLLLTDDRAGAVYRIRYAP